MGLEGLDLRWVECWIDERKRREGGRGDVGMGDERWEKREMLLSPFVLYVCMYVCMYVSVYLSRRVESPSIWIPDTVTVSNRSDCSALHIYKLVQHERPCFTLPYLTLPYRLSHPLSPSSLIDT